ncbi:DksA/TraR family C4-type zinc finger protein [Wenzhouxiangella limi]|uniref:DksA/TraR family C4-type zinc finger protein n=1 Tax=Wenzhouxiangella limi TaxID=2707351 RepID=A0A845V2H8_9GAMM|nr:DksA/TraR family C4-type zinc finger protein [Wenzhouxiangella limi]NDY95456.1 DksA/TraR family C4-type zinc finger protein [Wenzhouxiangella limi]
MAGGWARDGAVQDQIDSTVDEAVQRARAHLPEGPSRLECEECGDSIPEARRRALPGVKLCVACQEEMDSRRANSGGFNRRGCKDSQLR